MKHLFFLVFSFSCIGGFSQPAPAACDTVYTLPDVWAEYEGGERELMNYAMRDLSRIIANCTKPDEELLSKLLMTLTIDKNGNVTRVDFPRFRGSVLCEQELRKQLLSMTGWTAGKVNGKSVCSEYNYNIGCFYWKKY